MFKLPTQYKLGVLQGLIVEQPVQFCPLCRGAAVFVLNGDAVNGKGGAISELGFRSVGVHIIVPRTCFLRTILVKNSILFHLNALFDAFMI